MFRRPLKQPYRKQIHKQQFKMKPLAVKKVPASLPKISFESQIIAQLLALMLFIKKVAAQNSSNDYDNLVIKNGQPANGRNLCAGQFFGIWCKQGYLEHNGSAWSGDTPQIVVQPMDVTSQGSGDEVDAQTLSDCMTVQKYGSMTISAMQQSPSNTLFGDCSVKANSAWNGWLLTALTSNISQNACYLLNNDFESQALACQSNVKALEHLAIDVGEIIGITVGVVGGVVLICGVACCLYQGTAAICTFMADCCGNLKFKFSNPQAPTAPTPPVGNQRVTFFHTTPPRPAVNWRQPPADIIILPPTDAQESPSAPSKTAWVEPASQEDDLEAAKHPSTQYTQPTETPVNIWGLGATQATSVPQQLEPTKTEVFVYGR